MKAAVLSIDITPPIGLPIGGNVREDNIARGTHDNLYCNIVLLKEGMNRICLMGMDLLGLHYNSCRMIKDAVHRKTGINPDNIVVAATHTHSGPDLTEFFKDEIYPECADYIYDLAEKISEGVAQISNQMQDATIAVSKERVSNLSYNRRLLAKNGSIIMNWEYPDEEGIVGETGPIDEELHVISLCDRQNNILALVVNFTLHPAVLVGQDWLWSRDYVHYLDSYLKNKIGKDTVVLFANGAEGNINHIDFRNKKQTRGFAEAERIGVKLGEYVMEALKSSKPVTHTELFCVSAAVEFPLRRITDDDLKKAEELLVKCNGMIPSLLDGCPDEVYAKEIVKLSKRNEKYAATELQAVRVSSDTAIVTFPGEVFVELGLMIKKRSGYKNTLIFGLANDCIGYVPTAAAFRENGGYETKTAASSKLDPAAGDMLVAETERLLKRLKLSNANCTNYLP